MYKLHDYRAYKEKPLLGKSPCSVKYRPEQAAVAAENSFVSLLSTLSLHLSFAVTTFMCTVFSIIAGVAAHQ